MIDDDWTIITVDQHHKPVETIRRHGWFPTGSDPTVEVSGSRRSVTVLGATSHDGESFYFWTEDTLTAEHGVALLRALVDEFGEQLVILVDRAPYFYAKDVWEFVSGERTTDTVDDTDVERVVGPMLRLWYFPPHAPELNPVEQCWNQLESWFNYRLVRNLDQLKTLLNSAIATVQPPKISNYLCP